MAVVTEPAALLPLDAPPPQRRRYTLLDAAQTLTPDEERWLAGAWINAYPAGEVRTFDPCSAGTFRAKTLDATADRPMAAAFTVYFGGTCTGSSVGPTADRFKDRLRVAFEAVEAEAVERLMATGDGHATLGAYLADANMEALNGNTPVSPTEGLALLEDEIADTGGTGIIHAAPATATYWLAQSLIEAGRDNQLRTGLGTVVAVGAGYRGVDPDDWNAPSTGKEWAFATGPVAYIREPQVQVIPDTYGEALDRSSNEVTFIAERSYVLVWVGRQDGSDDNHVQAGVLIDRLT